MLPITKTRSFHIPHSLAVIAAAVALATAFAWSARSPELGQRQLAEDSSAQAAQPHQAFDPTGQASSAADSLDAARETSTAADAGAGVRPDRDASQHFKNRFPELLPPFLPRISRP
ncbi:MAG: hypothetical protein RQ741_00780 [Wenzhouxiangellaceae bacterium]|nr:hypothetical protein [Wenzhouxiangellaceae bacterium]